MSEQRKESVDRISDARVKEAAMGTQSYEVNPAAAALAVATGGQKPPLFSHGMIRLWLIFFVCYFVSTMNGFDGSLMGSINAMEQYHRSFNLSGAGSSAGIIFIIYNLGQLLTLPITGFIADKYGRRWCIFTGCAVVVIGTAIQTSSTSRGMFMGGRFILGFGASLAQAAAPVYVVELAHPSHRGIMAGMYNNFWWVGNILAGWTTYGSNLHLHSSWAWRVPTLVQCFMPSIVLGFIMFFPESPRWLISHDRRDEAIQIFAKYHADGDVNAPIVVMQVQEIEEQITQQQHLNDNPWWDFRELFDSRASRYRTLMVTCMAFFGQWSGNNVVSYFMPQMLKQAGITSSSTQLLLTAINPIFSIAGAIYGATLLDKLGRRKMLLIGLAGALGAYIALTAFTAERNSNKNFVYGVIVSIYVFGIFFAWGWTPLQVLYPVECLENRTRAKGAALKFLFLNIANMTNTYGIAVGIKAIGWKLYLVYIGWICVEMMTIYFLFVETAGKTLEEMSEIFESKNPVKKSLEKVKIRVEENGNVEVESDVKV